MPAIPFPIKETIDSRSSARNYRMVTVDPATLQAVKNFAANLEVPFDHDVEICFFQAQPTNTLYLTMKSPPNNIAFIAETDILSISKAGFLGELIILFAQNMGIATCWYGHYKLAELERLMPHLDSPDQLNESNMGYGYSKVITKGRRAICITPLGYYEDRGLRLMDRITEHANSFKRKEIEELLSDPADYDSLPPHFIYALDLARKAPSAANSQMWRFSFGDDYHTVTVSMPEGYKHFKWEHPNVDIGICASHLWLGLLDQGYDPKVSITENKGRAIWYFSL